MSSASFLVSAFNCFEVLRVSSKFLLDLRVRDVPVEEQNNRLAVFFHTQLETAKVHLTVRGSFDASRTYIVMSNHQSIYDIPVAYDALGANLRMVAKKELTNFPVWGPALLKSHYVFIDRKNSEAAKQDLMRASEVLRSGLNVWIAPEGTRSKDGKLGPFKMGGFHMALETGYPILPVTVDGTRNVLPPGMFRTRLNEKVTFTIHEPIDPQEYGANTKEARVALAARTREAIASALPA